MLTFTQYADLKNFLPYYQAGKINSSFMAAHLGISVQHVRRLIKSPLIAKPRTAFNRLSDEIREFVILEKKSNPKYNCQWLSEIASDRFGRLVSQSSVYRILQGQGLLSKIPLNRKPRTRFEAEKSGDLLQMDTTWGYWLNGQRINLTVIIDDYSRYILQAGFTYHDTAWWNMNMIRSVVEKYGLPRLLYTDNASFFKAIRHNQSIYQNHSQSEYESEITRACRELGITHLTHKPYQPQGKGKIERLFRFMQTRLITEIVDDQSYLPFYVADKKLQRWVDWYNSKHIIRTTHQTAKERFNLKDFSPLPKDKNLDDVFCFKDSRKVDKCNQFSYQGQVYTVPRKHCLVAYKVDLHIISDKFIRIWHGNEFICQLPIKPNNN